MPANYSKEKFWELYQKLPPDLKEVVFSEKTAETIYDACRENRIDDPSQLAGYVQEVLLGVLPPEDFQKTLEKELKLKKDSAKKVAQEINRFIFYPVRPFLEEIYKTGTVKPIGENERRKEKTPARGEVKEETEAPSRKDTYREPIE